MQINYKSFKTKNPTSKWIITVEAIHGDADKSENIECYFDSEEEFKKAYLEMKDWERRDKENRNKFYNDWEAFAREMRDEEHWACEWPSDCTSDENYMACFRGIREMVHYDKDGHKFEIEVKD